ncbi:ATP-binding protein [Actinomadura macrotermitis]|nr:ATP-binding protein [Actinomadura macrotermitis]
MTEHLREAAACRTPPRFSGPLLGEVDLAATPAAVRVARSYIRALVAERHPGAALDDLTLVTSEVVTNAIVHARPCPGGTILLTVAHSGGRLHVEVTDGGPGDTGPPPLPADLPDLGGRGLHLVEALTTAHGTRRNPDGTATSWFELHLGA